MTSSSHPRATHELGAGVLPRRPRRRRRGGGRSAGDGADPRDRRGADRWRQRTVRGRPELLRGAGLGERGRPAGRAAGRARTPADYLHLYQQAGKKYGVPWVVLAGIGEIESNQGRTMLPGVHSGANAFGAAGPLQIGIGGASGNNWGGAPVHPASEKVAGVDTDGNGDGIASVYEPADAIDGAAKYLVAHGGQNDVSGASFSYNHLLSYVQSVLHWASVYANGGFAVTAASTGGAVTA